MLLGICANSNLSTQYLCKYNIGNIVTCPTEIFNLNFTILMRAHKSTCTVHHVIPAVSTSRDTCSKKLINTSRDTCSKKLINTARAAYREKFLTAGIVDIAPREKATVSQHADNNILGPILPNTIATLKGLKLTAESDLSSIEN